MRPNFLPRAPSPFIHLGVALLAGLREVWALWRARPGRRA